MIGFGFQQGAASPCHFFHPGWGVRVLVHGDDFVGAGPLEGIRKFQAAMRKAYECSVEEAGMNAGQPKELRVLGRVISFYSGGLRYEADQRHAEALAKSLGLSQANAVKTPWAKEGARPGGAAATRSAREKAGTGVNQPDEEQLEPLSDKEATTYRSLSARGNYLAMDRADLQFPVKELMRSMSSPHAENQEKLKRVARYLVGCPRMAQEFPWQRRPETMTVYGDSDFAGCQRTRKSTSGGCAMWGRHTVKSWSKTQSIIALSSGEAELAAVVRCSTEAMGLKSLLADFGVEVSLEVLSDATAAIGMVRREGLGKVRHLAVGDLWVQAKESSGDIKYRKVYGKDNPADLMTKGLSEDDIQKHLHMMGYRVLTGRHPLTPALKADG